MRARLDLDLMRGAQPLTVNPVARYLGLRLTHLRQITTPLYAFQTSISQGGVLAGANRLVEATKIKQHTSPRTRTWATSTPCSTSRARKPSSRPSSRS